MSVPLSDKGRKRQIEKIYWASAERLITAKPHDHPVKTVKPAARLQTQNPLALVGTQAQAE
jgi:hypothetical protein